jgi:phosphoglycerol transferase
MTGRILLLIIIIASTALYSCSDTPPAKEQVQAGQASPATLSEGIDFTRPDYPAFVAETQGISVHEPWGRWTVGDKAIIKFKDNLPRSFVLELLIESAFGPNAGAPIKLRIGNREMLFLIMQPRETFLFDFALDRDVNTIEILIPKPTAPGSIQPGADGRLLGIGLVRLLVLPK